MAEDCVRRRRRSSKWSVSELLILYPHQVSLTRRMGWEEKEKAIKMDIYLRSCSVGPSFNRSTTWKAVIEYQQKSKERSPPLFPFKIERKKNCWWPKEGHLCKVKGVSHLAETTSNWVGWDFWWVHLLACLILFRRRRSSLNDGDVSFLLAFRWGT